MPPPTRMRMTCAQSRARQKLRKPVRILSTIEKAGVRLANALKPEHDSCLRCSEYEKDQGEDRLWPGATLFGPEHLARFVVALNPLV